MSRTPNRDVSKPIQILRNFLLGREHTSALRNVCETSPKTQPQPCLPQGPHARYAQNDYHLRDARHEVRPPMIIRPAKKFGNVCYRPKSYPPECPPVVCPCAPPEPSVFEPCSPRLGCGKFKDKGNEPPKPK